ncbi:hypothetical protein QQ045_001544 [Rhodiola kirilowii]
MVTNKFSPFSLQLCNIYTPTIFKLFQNEISSASAYTITSRDDTIGQYFLKSAIDGDEAIMTFSVDTRDILYSCKKFESWGYLCRHAIRILDLHFIFNILSKYILSRWKRDAVTRQIEDNSGHDIQENVHLDVSERYRHLCPKLVRLADYAAQSSKGYEFLLSQIDNLMKAVKIKGEEHVPIISPYDSSPLISYQGQDVKELAKKARNHKGDKRLKPWFEKHTKKKKNDGKTTIRFIRNSVVEMPANLAWLSEDRTMFDKDGQS